MVALVEALDNERHVLFNECLVWDGYVTKWNQPRVRRGGEWLLGSRIAYEHVYGLIAEGVQVLHTCDNPRCLNPFHLFEGTQKDNMIDAAQKGRLNLSKRGERHPAAKFSDELIERIRKASGTNREIAALYGCTHQYVSELKGGKKRITKTNEGTEDAEVMPQ